MISKHLQATRDCEDAIQTIADLIEEMPEGLPKYRLQAHIELMQRTMQRYIVLSGEWYDKLLDFAYEAAT